MPMDRERLARIRELFDSVADRPLAERAGLVAALSDGDDKLAREVLTLLAALDRDGLLFERPLVELLGRDGATGEDESGQWLGTYRLLRRIGQGGMGAVYEAVRDDHSLEQRFAIKLIRPGLGGELMVRRFHRERQILAALDHPGIARLLDSGVADKGRPYLVMEYVAGEALTTYCGTKRLGLRERVELFRQVCDAVQYAHRNLVIHRDLKPGNILVTAGGVVKLLDFGIAKLLQEGGPDEGTTLTQAGLRPLTPDYASPEQFEGEPLSVASDVYSLGVILYELLAGQRPFRLEDRSPAAVARILTAEPARPSTAVVEETAQQLGEPRADRLKRRLAGELDNIVLMALRKEPERRYASVEAFSEDLRRYLVGLPVTAQKATPGYRARKFVRRNRAAVAVAALLFFSLAGGIATTTWEAQRAGQQARVAVVERARALEQARIAQTERAKAERITLFLQKTLAAADPSWYTPGAKVGPGVSVGEALNAAARNVGTELRGDPEVEAAVRRTIGSTYAALGNDSAAEPQLRAALALQRRVQRQAHPDLARTEHDLGLLLMQRGRLAEAEPLLRQAVADYRTAGQQPEEAFGIAVNDLGVVLLQRGARAEAEPLLLEALAINRRLHGDAYAGVALNLGNLGTVRLYRGDYAAAESYYRQALASFAAVHSGREYYERAILLSNLGLLLTWRGEAAEAEAVLRESLAVWASTLGAGHRRAAVGTYANLAHLYYRTGAYDRAMVEVRRALQILDLSLPSDHLDRTRPETIAGLVLTAVGRSADAERRLRRVLAIRRGAFPPGDIRIAETAGALGLALAAQRKYTEAGGVLLESYHSLAAAVGAANPMTRDAADRLARLYTSSGDLRRAQTYRALASSH